MPYRSQNIQNNSRIERLRIYATRVFEVKEILKIQAIPLTYLTDNVLNLGLQ